MPKLDAALIAATTNFLARFFVPLGLLGFAGPNVMEHETIAFVSDFNSVRIYAGQKIQSTLRCGVQRLIPKTASKNSLPNQKNNLVFHLLADGLGVAYSK